MKELRSFLDRNGEDASIWPRMFSAGFLETKRLGEDAQVLLKESAMQSKMVVF